MEWYYETVMYITEDKSYVQEFYDWETCNEQINWNALHLAVHQGLAITHIIKMCFHLKTKGFSAINDKLLNWVFINSVHLNKVNFSTHVLLMIKLVFQAVQ